MRTTREVLEDHLRRRQAGDLEGDIRHNYAEDVVILTMEGEFHGAEGVRANADELQGYLGGSEFSFPVVRVANRFAFIEWRAEAQDALSRDGSDTFVIENGRIVCQTIRYTVHQGAGERTPEAGRAEPRFQARVIHHNDTEVPRFGVEFIGDGGDSVTVECHAAADGERTIEREQVIDSALKLVRAVARDGIAGREERLVDSTANTG